MINESEINIKTYSFEGVRRSWSTSKTKISPVQITVSMILFSSLGIIYGKRSLSFSHQTCGIDWDIMSKSL